MAKRKTWIGRIYTGRDPETGKQRFEWVGRFDTKRERDAAVAKRREELSAGPDLPTCDEYVATYMREYLARNPKSATTQGQRLRRFTNDFAGHSLDLSRAEVKAWAAATGRWSRRQPVPNGDLAALCSLYNYAIDDDDLPLPRNPARKLANSTKGRADTPPPTPAQFDKLLDGCAALDDYGATIRAIFEFAAFTLMRPGELYELEWSDIDFKRMRIAKARRVYRGEVAEPKTGPKVIALTPPARDAILNLDRSTQYVFPAKRGGRMSASGFSGYWGKVQAAAGLEFEFYLASKHYGVWFMWTQLGMSDRAIAAQAGWSLRTVTKMLATYGHGDVGALDEVDAAFADHRPKLRALQGGKAG